MSSALAAAAVALCGAGLVAAGFAEKPASAAERFLRVALAVALGLGTWSAAYAASLLLAGPAARTGTDALLAAIGAGLLLAARRKPATGIAPRDAAPWWMWAALGAAAALAVVVFALRTAREPDGGYDAFMIWNLRARFLARGGAGFRAAFSPEMGVWAHQDYPFLVPGLVAQGFLLSGREPRWVPVLFAAAFGVLAVAIPALALARSRGQRWGLLAAIALFSTPCFAVFAAHQESDVPLAVYVASSAVLLLLADERENARRLLLLAGFAAGLGAWTKNEGTLYAACLGAALLLRSRDWRRLAWFACGAAPAAALLAGFKLEFAPSTDLWRFSTAATVLAHAFDPARWARLALLTLRRIVYFQDFALWVAAEVLVLVVWVRKLPATVPGTALFLACAAYAPVYVLQPYPIEWLYPHSVERIFIQLWPAAILATLLAVAAAVGHPADGSEGAAFVQ